jgi:hypothetical protein
MDRTVGFRRGTRHDYDITTHWNLEKLWRTMGQLFTATANRGVSLLPNFQYKRHDKCETTRSTVATLPETGNLRLAPVSHQDSVTCRPRMIAGPPRHTVLCTQNVRSDWNFFWQGQRAADRWEASGLRAPLISLVSPDLIASGREQSCQWHLVDCWVRIDPLMKISIYITNHQSPIL